MDDVKALSTIEAYFAKRVSKAEYEFALQYFATTPATRSRLAKLYRELVEPGGISCEQCQDEMAYFLDPVVRLEMSKAARESFLLHLSQCEACAEEYLELAAFAEKSQDVVAPSFKVPGLSPIPWPQNLHPQISSSPGLPGFRIHFTRPEFASLKAVAEEKAAYSVDTKTTTLFSHQLDKLELKGVATRISAQLCEVTVTLRGGPLPVNLTSRIILSYDQTRLENPLDSTGVASFPPLPIAALPKLEIEVVVSSLN